MSADKRVGERAAKKAAELDRWKVEQSVVEKGERVDLSAPSTVGSRAASLGH